MSESNSINSVPGAKPPVPAAPNGVATAPGTARPEARRGIEKGPVKRPEENDLFRTEKAGALVMAARMALRKGQKEEARAKLQQAFALSPSDCGAIELLGDIYLEEAEQEKAIQVFEKGLKYHPRHHAFEEKIALAHLDLDEMRRDEERKKLFLEQGIIEKDKWMDRKPSVALTLSMLIPGAGQVYNEENERAAAFFTVWVVTFLAWYYPLATAIKQVTSTKIHRLNDLGAGIGALSGFAKFMLVLIGLVWLVSYVWAVVDAYTGAERANRERRREFGV